MAGVNIAVIGATGMVGERLLATLASSSLKINNLALLAASSAGQVMAFVGQELTVQKLDGFCFDDVQIVFMCTDAAVSKQYAEQIAESGPVVIDLSSNYRTDSRVPLVIPEVNALVLAQKPAIGIIANPNCSTAQLLMPLAPLAREFGLESLHVATYQSASGAGRQLCSDLLDPNCQSELDFNLLPTIDCLLENGFTGEEMKLRNESRKILGLAGLPVSATCVRVPVAVGHAEALMFSLSKKVQQNDLEELLSASFGVEYSADKLYSPKDCVGSNDVFVCRLRQDLDDAKTWHMWIVADNLQKGAALNAVQIAEHMVQCKWFKQKYREVQSV